MTLVTIILGLASTPVFANGPVAALVIEEHADGTPGEARLFVAKDESWLDVNVMKSVEFNAPWPFVALGGKLGVETLKGMVEVGAEGLVFAIPPGDNAFGLQFGGYLQLAPIPGSWGKRFYLKGAIYRLFAMGDPAPNGWGAAGALGYRQPFPYLGDSKYLFFEAGLERQVLSNYGDDILIYPRALNVGVTW